MRRIGDPAHDFAPAFLPEPTIGEADSPFVEDDHHLAQVVVDEEAPASVARWKSSPSDLVLEKVIATVL